MIKFILFYIYILSLNEGEIINDYIQNKTSFQTSQQDKSCSIQ